MSLNPQISHWFNDGKYGLFIHFGLYSMLGGEYKGQESQGIAEWIMNRLDIPREEYEQLAADFDPSMLDPQAICEAAKRWGMTYLCLTSKHHDGFALFDSKADPYNSVQASLSKRDFVREFAEACAEHDLVFCLYYSQAQDWHHPDGYSAYHDNAQKDFERYFREKCLPQVDEILTQYGPIGMLWFDTPMEMTVEQSTELRDFVKERQPECIISGRIGNAIGDYLTTNDNMLPAQPIPQAWELPATLNSSWGYKKRDHDWRNPENVFREFVKVVSRGGNYLLNIGPRGDGSVPEPSLKILEQVGQMIDPVKEAIYGTRVTPPYVYEQNEFVLTCKPNKLYLFLLGSQGSGTDRSEGLSVRERGFLALHNIGNEVQDVTCLSHDIEVKFNDGMDLEGHSYWTLQWEPQEEFMVFAFDLKEAEIVMESI